MIPSFPSVTSAGPPPHRHRQVFFLSHDGIACFKHHGFGGLFLPPSMWVGYLGNLGTEDPSFFQKWGGLGIETTPFQTYERKTRTTGTKHGKHGKNHLERKLVIFFDDESSAILRNSIPLIFFGSNLSLARGNHGTDLLVARISFHWASPSHKVIEGGDGCTFEERDRPMEIWMNLILYQRWQPLQLQSSYKAWNYSGISSPAMWVWEWDQHARHPTET